MERFFFTFEPCNGDHRRDRSSDVEVKRAATLVPVSLDKPSLTMLHILIVDDDRVDRKAVAEMLRGWSMRAASAGSGREALTYIPVEAARNDAVDLVVMDWKMPDADAVRVARDIQNLGLVRAPVVIMLTAYGREQVLGAAESIGIEASLVKSINPSMLLETVVAAFGQTKAASTIIPAQNHRELRRLHSLPKTMTSITRSSLPCSRMPARPSTAWLTAASPSPKSSRPRTTISC